MKAHLLACALMVAACTTLTPQATIASLEVGLTTAEEAALVYANSPAADPRIVARVVAADEAAYHALKAAEAVAASGGNPDLTAIAAALSAMQALIPPATDGATTAPSAQSKQNGPKGPST